MKNFTIMLLAAAVTAGAHSAPAQERLTQCLADATTGKDRKDLARWMVAAMAQHPAIADMASIPMDKVDELNKTTAALMTRLITTDCAGEVKSIPRAERELAVRGSFDFLGRLAMQELVANPKVAEAISGLGRYADYAKLQQTLQSN